MPTLSNDPPESNNETSELCVPAIAYNVEVEDDFGIVDDQFITFREFDSILYRARKTLRGIDDILVDMDECDDEGRHYRNGLCQLGLKSVIADLERIKPRRNPCMVRIEDPSEALVQKLADKKKTAASIRQNICEADADLRTLHVQQDKVFKERKALKAELREGLKERDALRQEQGPEEVAQ